MPFSFNCFCCSVARTKPYKKHHKKDHVALYQYVICGPGQSAGQYWGNTKSCEIWEKMTLIYSFIIFSSTPVLEYYYFFKYFSFPCVFLSIHGFKFTGFLILAISNPGDSCKLLQRQKIQARENRTMARTNAVKNHGVKLKDKVYMS